MLFHINDPDMSNPIGTIWFKRRWSAPWPAKRGSREERGFREEKLAHVLEPSVPAHLDVVHVIEHMGKPEEETSSDRCVNEMPVGAGKKSEQVSRKQSSYRTMRCRTRW